MIIRLKQSQSKDQYVIGQYPSIAVSGLASRIQGIVFSLQVLPGIADYLGMKELGFVSKR